MRLRHGTLIVAIGCREGIVLVADKLISGITTRETGTKIHPLGEGDGTGAMAVFTLSGTCDSDGEEGEEDYRLAEEIQRCFRGIDANHIGNHWRRFGSYITKSH